MMITFSTSPPSPGLSPSLTTLHQKKQRRRDNARYFSFAAAIIACLCAGSINAYSIYGHLFQERLEYTQMQVNMVSIAAELALYLPVSAIGWICDRVGPAPLSFVSAILFMAGYLLAAFTYRNGPNDFHCSKYAQIPSVWLMVIAFVIIGLATTLMYLSAVTTCAKNYGKGKHKGLALASPIAAFGLSGLWQSQFATRVLYERLSDEKRGDVDVFKFFLFLAFTLSVVGFVGTFLLKIVDNDDFMCEVAEERSGLLENTEWNSSRRSYGSTENEPSDQEAQTRRILVPKQEILKKTLSMSQQKNDFLQDHTMWWLAAGFFLVSGPGEAFNTNLGTILGTLHPVYADPNITKTTAATQISIVAITSTIARLAVGTLTDLVAPTPARQSSLMEDSPYRLPQRYFCFSISRVSFLIGSGLLLSTGQIILAAGFIQSHAERFWIVSTLIGSGYGALFSLTPLIISVIWGVDKFATNWGIIAMVPALGATFWSLIYSLVYQASTEKFRGPIWKHENVFCYGKVCYSTTFWAMCVSVWAGCLSWLWAWKGRGGWTSRGLYV